MSESDLKVREAEIEQLVVEAQNGDHDAFAKIYDIFVDPLYRYIFFRVANNDSEDLLENLFIRVWEHLGKYEKRKSVSFSSWVFRIAHNLVVDYYRAAKGEPMEISPQLPDQSRVHNPIRNTQNSLDRDILRTAVLKLKKEYQDVIIHKFVNDLSNEEIAEMLGKNDGALRILQFRALKALKKVLEDMGIHY